MYMYNPCMHYIHVKIRVLAHNRNTSFWLCTCVSLRSTTIPWGILGYLPSAPSPPVPSIFPSSYIRRVFPLAREYSTMTLPCSRVLWMEEGNENINHWKLLDKFPPIGLYKMWLEDLSLLYPKECVFTHACSVPLYRKNSKNRDTHIPAHIRTTTILHVVSSFKLQACAFNKAWMI